jgi:hypothetical protein
MEETALEIIRGIYCRTLDLDPDLLDGLAEIAESDTEFDFTDAYPDGKRVRGVAGVRRIAAKWPWEGLRFQPERFLELHEGRVLVFVRATATGVGSGVEVERRTAHECLLDGGRLVHFKVYSDREQALADSTGRWLSGSGSRAGTPRGGPSRPSP